MRRRRRSVGDRGQASVEFALALPLVMALVLGVIQVVVVGSRQAAVERLARDGARAAGVSARPQAAAERAVHDSTGLPVAVTVRTTSSTVTVVVSYVDPTSVPIIGRAIPDVELEASATMPREPP